MSSQDQKQIRVTQEMLTIGEGQAPALQFIPKRVNVAVKQEATIMSGEEQTYRIVRKYSWLKEQMTRDLAVRIADKLFASGDNANGLISDAHHEEISSSKKRRKVVQKLLQRILYGADTVYRVFMDELENNRGDVFIAEELQRTPCTCTDLQEFKQLQKSLMDGSARPHSADERFTLFANDRQILQYYFNDEVTLDYANDHFLSELFFAIREHTNIYSCSMDEEKRTNLLLQTMSKCSIKIRETFMAVLKELSMEHVASLMSWWEDEAVPMDATTSTFSLAEPSPPIQKSIERIEMKLVTDPKYLRMAALKELGGDIEQMETGSIIIRLVSVLDDQWNSLKQKCYSGEIKDFITAVYKKEGVVKVDDLEEGCYHIDVKIFREIIQTKDAKSESDKETRVVIHLSNTDPMSVREELRNETRQEKETEKNNWQNKLSKSIKKHIGSSPSPPIQTVQEVGGTFGVPLECCTPSQNNEFVPLIVDMCTQIVEAKGLEMTGVYRIPGNKAAVTLLQEEFNKGIESMNLDHEKWSDVNGISSLLKSFFQQLPEALVTGELYQSFIDAIRIEHMEKRMVKLKRLIHELPEHHFETFKHFAKHLNRVAIYGDVNRMEAKNLAMVFGPTLIRKTDDNMTAMFTDMSDQCKIIESIILHCDWFFGSWDMGNYIPTDDDDTECTSTVSALSSSTREDIGDDYVETEIVESRSQSSIRSGLSTMDQRSLLRKNRNKIIEEMVNPVEVSDVLCMKGVFTWYMVEEVQEKKTSLDQVRKILDIIPRRGPQAFDKFYETLLLTDNDRVADLLRPELAGTRKPTTRKTGFANVVPETELPAGLSSTSNFIETNMDILCEEMGVSSSLMSYLKFHGIIDGRDEDYTYKILSRSGRILYLLKKIVDKGPEEVKRFEEYVKTSEPDVYDEVQSLSKTKQVPQYIPVFKELLYSTTAVLNTRRSSTVPPQLEFICTDLMNPRCYFANTEKESGGSQSTMPYNFLVLADENNENIVLDIVERLEKEKVHGQGVKGYWMSRDALPVMPVFDSIIDSIRKSQFILILLDPGNISVWMKRQIDLSLKIVLQSRMDSIIPIYLRDPANPQEKDNIPMGLQILKGLKYIKNDLDNEALFWKELGKAVIGREI